MLPGIAAPAARAPAGGRREPAHVLERLAGCLSLSQNKASEEKTKQAFLVSRQVVDLLDNSSASGLLSNSLHTRCRTIRLMNSSRRLTFDARRSPASGSRCLLPPEYRWSLADASVGAKRFRKQAVEAAGLAKFAVDLSAPSCSWRRQFITDGTVLGDVFSAPRRGP